MKVVIMQSAQQNKLEQNEKNRVEYDRKANRNEAIRKSKIKVVKKRYLKR